MRSACPAAIPYAGTSWTVSCRSRSYPDTCCPSQEKINIKLLLILHLIIPSSPQGVCQISHLCYWHSSQNSALCTRCNRWIFVLGKKGKYERKNICTGSKMSIFAGAVQWEALASHYSHCSWNILERVSHSSAKLSCKVMSNMRPSILASKCNKEVINSASGQPTLKQLHSCFHKHFNMSFLIALLVQEGLHDKRIEATIRRLRINTREVSQACQLYYLL